MKKSISVRLLCLAAMLCLIVSSTVTFASAEEKPTLSNIALEKPVEATSSYHPPEGFFHEDFLVDGDWDTYPGTTGKLGWNTDTTGEPVYEDTVVDLTIDLQGAYKAEKVVLKPMKWANGQGFPRDFTLQASPDGKTWTDIKSVTDVDATAASNTDVQPIVFEFEPVAMRYFRMHITKHSAQIDQGGSYISAIGELELWGFECDPSELPETEPETFTVTFVAGSQIVDRVTFTAGTTSIVEPPVPEKEGFTGEWAKYTMKDQNFTVKAVYTVIEPETDPATQPGTEPATEPATEPVTDSATEAATEAPAETPTEAPTEGAPAEKPTESATDAPAKEGGCKSLIGTTAVILTAVAAAVACRKKH